MERKNISLPNKNRQSHIINSISWHPNEMYNFSWFSLNDHHNLKTDTSDFNTDHKRVGHILQITDL